MRRTREWHSPEGKRLPRYGAERRALLLNEMRPMCDSKSFEELTAFIESGDAYRLIAAKLNSRDKPYASVNNARLELLVSGSNAAVGAVYKILDAIVAGYGLPIPPEQYRHK
jgi:hypothetical protein